jgi:hypothetical protein
MRAGDEPTEFLDFASLLSAPIKGELPLLVGGHAVNVWAWFYRNRIGNPARFMISGKYSVMRSMVNCRFWWVGTSVSERGSSKAERMTLEA